MTTLRQFCLEDLLTFNSINLDVLTETYNGAFKIDIFLLFVGKVAANCFSQSLSSYSYHITSTSRMGRFILHGVSVEMA
jgi:hypothetical protein